ncbi:MAG: TonB-dependent receptor [Bacteroidales bacterium]|nr:TonB-dependent receptor [Bacteroidales bacterium]
MFHYKITNRHNHIINDGYNQGGKPREFLFHGTDFTGGLSAYQVVPTFTGNNLTVGTDILYYGGNAYRDPVKEIYADHKKLHEEAVYIFDQQTVGKFMFNAGIRMDNHSAYGIEWIPQAGISFMPGRNTTIKASASKGFRMPNMRELYMYAVANEDLKPEKAWSYDFTVGQHFLDGALNVEASVFYTKGSNIIEVTVVEGKRQNRNVGEFENMGVELSADYRVTPTLSFNTNYSFLHMGTIYTGAPEHKFYFGGNWTPGKFTVNLGAMAINGLYLTTGDNALIENYVDVKAKVGYQITKNIGVFVRGANLLNQKYATMEGFPEPGVTVLGGVSISL